MTEKFIFNPYTERCNHLLAGDTGNNPVCENKMCNNCLNGLLQQVFSTDLNQKCLEQQCQETILYVIDEIAKNNKKQVKTIDGIRNRYSINQLNTLLQTAFLINSVNNQNQSNNMIKQGKPPQSFTRQGNFL